MSNAAATCSLGCTTSCKAREHGVPSECPVPAVGRALDDLSLIEAVLKGFPRSMAQADALAAVRRLLADRAAIAPKATTISWDERGTRTVNGVPDATRIDWGAVDSELRSILNSITAPEGWNRADAESKLRTLLRRVSQ